MKKFLLAALLMLCVSQSFAAHIKGGFFTYQYLGPGIVNPTFLRYKISFTFYTGTPVTVGTPPNTQVWDPINYTIFQGTNPTPFASVPVNISRHDTLTKFYASPCIVGSFLTGIYYEFFVYELNDYEVPATPDGYTISYQKCCRIAFMDNIPISDDVGNTWTIHIPGTNAPIPNADHNSSPVFPVNDTVLVCQNNFFTYPFAATDPDGDSLSYSFCYAYGGGSQANINPDPSSAPPYASVPYTPPFSGSQPLGAGVTINPVTGLISGTAPPIINTGEYVVTVCIKEYREGIYFADSRKELHIRVKDCIPLSASSNFTPITCDGFTVNFANNSSGNPTNFDWDFGDPLSGAANTSNLPNPTHTFTAAGTFNVKLLVSIGGQCADSITKPLGVFPGFFPGFKTSAPLCVGAPVQFTDTSKTNYGVVDSWRWDFGDLVTLADTSHLPDPVYTYNPGGNYTVQLKVTNSKGCEKTIDIPVFINDNPLLSVFPVDSMYCGLDSLQLNGVGTGSFSWTPLLNIVGANTSTPLVFPPVQRKYYAQLTNAAGCKSLDSLTVIPKFDLSNAIAGPVNICAEDTVTLTGSCNYPNNLTWQWTPIATAGAPANNATTVYPMVNTTYTLITRWGNNCVATKTHNIIVKPLAIPNAGPDAFVCAGGQSSTQLNASGGNTYQWTPVTGLNNPNIPNPIALPLIPTNYIVAVGVTGCSKTKTDTIFVDVGLPPALSTLNDTLICNIDTLQLTSIGVGNFSWSPNYMISSTTAASPLVSPDVPTWYHVRLTAAIGCYTDDSVFVDVKNKVTISAGPDTSICKTDGFLLNPTGDALRYTWSPPTYLNATNIMHPFSTPLTTITYTVIGNIGKCQSQDEVNIRVASYPPANAGPDLALCPGFSVQLNATGGSSYVWSPITFLNDRFIPDPVCGSPYASIRYIVTVSDTLGCSKSAKDTVWVIVHPKAIANAGPRDTSVVLGEPLALHATGGVNYAWSPATWLNDPNIATAVSLPQDSIRYVVLVTTINGCQARDTIDVYLFNMDPDLYVPTAFTPNRDGTNDVLRPILIGMKELTYFKVFNRFGEMVFSTNEQGKGWDGIYGGKPQDPATFVWYAEGVTYKGQVRRKKGYAVLIR